MKRIEENSEYINIIIIQKLSFKNNRMLATPCNTVPWVIYTSFFFFCIFLVQHEMQLQIPDIRANRKGMGMGNGNLQLEESKYI